MSMRPESCESVRQAIPWLLDDELGPEQSLEIEGHLEGCTECRAELEREGRLRVALRRVAVEVRAPASLRRRVRETMDRDRETKTRWHRLWPVAAAAMILSAFVWRGIGTESNELFEAAERHGRNLPLDVVAADIGQVQQFFDDKLPFAMHLPRIGPPRVERLGGRLTTVGNRDAAYVRYEMTRGRLSMFVYEDPGFDVSDVAPLYRLGGQRVLVQRVRGYTVARWRTQGVVYSVITDMPERELSSVLVAGMR